jgi:hypothetical protein
VRTGRPPKIKFKQYQFIKQVWEARRAIPGDKELARKFGIRVATIRAAMTRGIEIYDHQLRAKHGRKSET